MIPLHRSFCILTILVLACTLPCLPPASAADHVVAPSGAEFTSIKDAVDWSSGGDTIRVESGTYTENIKLDKKLFLIGVDSGGGAPVITSGKTANIVEILADGCSIQGFTIQNSGTASGIRVTSNNDFIQDNTLKGNAEGIDLASADNNTIIDNEITGSNRAGIVLESAGGNLIDENTIDGNYIGIMLDESSPANTISRNSFSNTQNVISRSPSSMWSTGASFSYTYLGQSEQSRLGNYWDNYRGRDRNGDGIGDTPYITSISTGTNGNGTDPYSSDAYPLMDPPEYYTGMMTVTAAGTGGPATSLTTPARPITTAIPSPVKTLPATAPVPSAPVPASRTQHSIPLTAVALVLIGLVMAGIGGWIFLARKHAGLPLPSPVPAVTQAASVLRTAVERTRALVTMPGIKTVAGVGATMTSPQPAATDQKNYFPRELENKYTDIMFVGRGGIAWVFSAVRKTDGVRVAVKIPISFDEVTGKCFLNEIAAWETLRHPNIVEVSAVNILPVPYVEMEYVPGSLEELSKPMPVWKAVHLITGVSDGLRYAHEHGFIHRDIKPHNILLTKDLVPKITDWGMSKVLAADVKKSSVAGFSLSYAAPEQVSPSGFGRTDERTDLYQLGVVFYELVTGSIPFGGESIVEVGNAILREEPIPPSEYNPDAEAVEKIILKCLEKDPAKRYQSASELREALQGYLDEDDD